MNDDLILVDENDNAVGKLGKFPVHKLGLLHRAFSIFIFTEKGELILQQRADDKYHSAGLWTNTCCSHPAYNEDLHGSVRRRLYQEMRLTCKTHFAFSFTYKAFLENGMIENEYDHVFFGISNDVPVPNISEVKSWKYITLENLENDIILHPTQFTEWLKICFQEVKNHFKKFFSYEKNQVEEMQKM